MNDLQKKIVNIFTNGFLGIGLSVGYNLGIFDAIGEVATEQSPATAEAIAEKAGLKPRYVKEYLGMVACAGFVEVDESGEHFWIKEEYRKDLCGPEAFFGLPGMNMIRLQCTIVDKIEAVFRKDGPRGTDWNDYKGFQKYIESFTAGRWGKEYGDKFAAFAGISDKIANYKKAIDVGCGNGYHLKTFSKAFPQIHFDGVDLSKEGIENAKKKNLKNVVFHEMNAEAMPKEWANTYDWVMMFDCAHDQPRPDLTFKEIYRILKDGGVFTMVDVDGTGNIYLDKKMDAQNSTLLYLFSVFSCLPCSSNAPDALCLGCRWGRKQPVEMLNACGFTDVKVVDIPIQNQVLFVCTKHSTDTA